MEISEANLPSGTDKIFDLCANCARFQKKCPGLPKDTVYTGCIFYEKAAICRYIMPGLLEDWYIRFDPRLSWTENRKRGEKLSGGKYIGPSVSDENYMKFRKLLNK